MGAGPIAALRPTGSNERGLCAVAMQLANRDLEIAAEIGISNQKAARWRGRFLKLGLAGLEKDAPRPGRTPTITAAKVQEVVRRTTQEKPVNATQWSTRTMAEAAGLSEKSVRRIWHKHGLKPHLPRTGKVSNDPEFVVRNSKPSLGSISTHQNTPSCFAPMKRVRSKHWTAPQPGLSPLKKGRCGTMTHDYKRNGTATLFARL